MKEANHISEAEWQVMRIIWSQTPITSNYIFEALRGITNWSPTTIKTLLARLVKKNVIGFEQNNRTYYYYPILTEEECIRKEFQLFLDRIYGSVKNKETTHFNFCGTNLEEYIERLKDVLESNYERIAADLNYNPEDKITVYIHPSIERLHSALGVLNGPRWLRTGWSWGILHIVSPVYFTDISAEKVAIHSLCEIIIQKINPSTPYWINQGIAAYEGQWLEKSWVNDYIHQKLKDNQVPTLAQLSSDYSTLGGNGGAIFSYTIAEYIAKEYGVSYYTPLLKSPNDFNGVFGLTEEEFYKNWSEYLIRNYS